MSSLRLSFLLSLLVHGAALGTACALGLGNQAMRPSFRIEVRPSEHAAAVLDAPPPVEAVEVDGPDEPALLEELPEPAPEPTAGALDPRAFAAEAEFALAESTEPVPEWLAAVRVVRAPLPEPTAPPPPAPSSHVVEVVPGENPPPPYPWLARRHGWQGVVAVAVQVAADGSVLGATVARSSGHEVLDAAAVRAVRGWRFRGGAGATTVEVEFVLRAG